MSATGVPPITAQSSSIGDTRPGAPRVAQSPRRTDIDYSKAVAIVLVVIGHISDPASPAWAQVLKTFIYNFHMPLFMYLSGFVFFVHFDKHRGGAIRPYVAGRADRLLTVFVAFYILALNLKFFAKGFLEVRRSGFSYLGGFQFMVLHTQQSPALDLWYLVTLFVFSVVTFIGLRVHRSALYGLSVLALTMYAVFAETEQTGGLTDDFYLGRICWFYIFFMMGCLASRHWTKVGGIFERAWAPAFATFLAYQAFIFLGPPELVSGWRFLIAGGLSIVAVQGFANAHMKRPNGVLQTLSEYTLIIYLLNSIVIGAALPLLRHVLSVQDHMPAFYAILTPLGLMVPIAIRFGLKRAGVPPAYMRYVS